MWQHVACKGGTRRTSDKGGVTAAVWRGAAEGRRERPHVACKEGIGWDNKHLRNCCECFAWLAVGWRMRLLHAYNTHIDL
eukprot:866044-Pelagomonas_calceolata.AAC.3